jgi:hypothetical protein
MSSIHFQTGAPQWTDSRPVGFARWNEIYFREFGPSVVAQATENGSFEEHDLQHLLSSAQRHIHPRYAAGEHCTALLGSPGPYSMEFISVSCIQELNTSGVLCISGGNKSVQSTTYSLHHWGGLAHEELYEVLASSPANETLVHVNILCYNAMRIFILLVFL